MIEVEVPGWKTLRLEHLVLDYNGTLALDGRLLEGARESLKALSSNLALHVVTADTFGGAEGGLHGIPCKLVVLPAGDQAEAKADYLRKLGAENSAAIGNGRNDRLMLKEAALALVVVQNEGAAVETLLSAQVVCADISDALDLLLHPLRLVSTLRS